MRDIFINAFDDKDDDSDEQSADNDGNIISPKRFDIICGRDKLSCAHVGNNQFRIIIEMSRERYQTAPSRDDKTRITCDMADHADQVDASSKLMRRMPTTGKMSAASM
jgi:hypothetical protein